MIEGTRPQYSVNRYDKDGNVLEYGVYLHFPVGTSIWICDSILEFDMFIEDLKNISTELKENGYAKRLE